MTDLQPIAPFMQEIQARIEQIKNDPNRHTYLLHRTRMEEKLEADRTAQEVEKAQALSMLGERYQRRTFASFDPKPQVREAYEKTLWVAEDPKQRGVLLSGQPGLGKTHLVSALAHHCLENGIPVICDSVPAILRRIRSTYDNDAKISEMEIITRIARIPVLILDDLAKERITEWSMSMLWDLVNERYEQNLPIVVTTNLPTTEMYQHYYSSKVPAHDKSMGESFVRRLTEMASPWVNIIGKAPR